MSIEHRHMQSETQNVTGIEAGYSRVLIDIDEAIVSALHRERHAV
jgi:hypothetical protein